MDGQAHLGHGFDVHRVGHDEAERFRAVVERAGRQHRLEDFKKKSKNQNRPNGRHPEKPTTGPKIVERLTVGAWLKMVWR